MSCLSTLRGRPAIGSRRAFGGGREDGLVGEQRLDVAAHLCDLAPELDDRGLRLVREALVMVDPGLLGDRSHERRNGRDREDRDRDERQAEAELDEPQAVAAVEDRVSRGVVRRLFGGHATSEA